MSKIHILQENKGVFRAVIHTPVLAGSNTAGKTWKEVLLSSGLSGSSVLTVGTSAGNITQVEMDTITTGDVLEFEMNLRVESGGATLTSLNEMVNEFLLGKQKELKATLKYYGFTN